MSATYFMQLAPGEAERLKQDLMPHFMERDEGVYPNEYPLPIPKDAGWASSIWINFTPTIWKPAHVSIDYNAGMEPGGWADAVMGEIRERYIITRFGHCSAGWWDQQGGDPSSMMHSLARIVPVNTWNPELVLEQNGEEASDFIKEEWNERLLPLQKCLVEGAAKVFANIPTLQ